MTAQRKNHLRAALRADRAHELETVAIPSPVAKTRSADLPSAHLARFF
jgi:hypothetical protein